MTNPDVFILCNSKLAENESSRVLEAALREQGVACYRVTPGNNPKFSPERVRAIINYGVSREPAWIERLPRTCKWYNDPVTVATSASKLRMFDFLRSVGVPTLDYTTDRLTAAQWALLGDTVVARSRVGGRDGAGITLSPPEMLPDARLYTKLFDGEHVREYRAYVVGGKVVDLAERRRQVPDLLRRRGIENTELSRTVRSYSNGWIFARNTMDATQAQRQYIREFSEPVARAMNLGLGSIDTIVRYNRSGELDDIRVVETNTQICLRGDQTTRRVLAEALANELGG